MKSIQTVSNAPFDVESEDLDPIIIFSLHSLLARVELLALIDILSASIAPPKTTQCEKMIQVTVTYIEKGAMRRTTC